MKQPRSKIAKAIADKTLRSGSNKRYAQEVAAYLLAERRVNELDSLLRDVQADWAQSGHVEVLAASAHDLSPAIKAEIERQIKRIFPDAKKIIVTEVHDSEVIGGVRLSLADRQLDLSIEAKLNKFKQLTNV
jgi:F0F1-type ATP synthase delta subunit